jgi:pimeloyl-ACP methyl ester carboxylesterase
VTVPTLVCHVAGDGTPAALLHGIGGSARVWRPLASALDGYRLLSYDLPGHGDAPAPAAPFELTDVAAAVHADLTSRALGPTIVCGHSVGALIGLLVALEDPTLVSRLILIATDADPSGFGWLTDGVVSELARTRGMDAVFDYALEHDGTMAAVRRDPRLVDLYRSAFTPTDALGYAALADAIATRPQLAPRLSELACPVLVICGADDEGFVAPSRRLAAATGGRYVEVPGAGHLPMLDDRDLVAREIRAVTGEA